MEIYENFIEWTKQPIGKSKTCNVIIPGDSRMGKTTTIEKLYESKDQYVFTSETYSIIQMNLKD